MSVDVWVRKGGEFLSHERLCSATGFEELRRVVHGLLEQGSRGSRFPLLLNTSAAEAKFTRVEAEMLLGEVTTVRQELQDVTRFDTKHIEYVKSTYDLALDSIQEACELALETGGDLGWTY